MSSRPFNLLAVLALVFTYFILSSCGSGGGSSITGSNKPQPYNPVTTPLTTLQGASTSKAIDNTINVNAITGVAQANITTDPATGSQIAITRMQIRLKENATVGDVNGLLSSLGAEVISMFENAPFLLIRIPNPGGLIEYNQIITDIQANAFVEYVSPGYFPATRGMPDNHAVGDGNTDMISHHLAVRAHAAWHVRNLADMSLLQPHLVIADAFGDGNPGSDYNIASLGTSFFNTNDPRNHGYGVLGVILAKFDGDSSTRGLQTGIYPSALSISAFDVTQTSGAKLKDTFNAVEDLIIHAVKSQLGRPTIVNTSIGFPCNTAENSGNYCVDSWARNEGFDWLTKVRATGLEGRFLHVTAAGNISPLDPTNTHAMYDSPFSAARLINDFTLSDGTGTLITPLQNTLVVESLVQSSDTPYEPVCLSDGSKFDGDIAAIGYRVSSLTGNSDPAGIFTYSGTSFAAPQVAGIAANLWAIDPSLTASSVINRLNRTSNTSVSGTGMGCSSRLSARVVDAYSAVLSADTILTPAQAPVRSELMDVADTAGAPGSNGQFDEKDIQLLTDMYRQQAGELDYSRYDLNGDGFTGGPNTERFDLDLDATFTTINQTIIDTDISFNEAQTTDYNIMCYYAYSDLYAGNPQARDNMIRDMCGVPDCLYTETYNGPGNFTYRKVCYDPVPIVRTIIHSESSGFTNITILREDCYADNYLDLLTHECPGDEYSSYVSVRYAYNSWVDESSIALDVTFLNRQYLDLTYYCEPGGQLDLHYNTPQTSEILGEYGTLEACHTALKQYIPVDANTFDNPGDCHNWWDHGTEECKS